MANLLDYLLLRRYTTQQLGQSGEGSQLVFFYGQFTIQSESAVVLHKLIVAPPFASSPKRE